MKHFLIAISLAFCCLNQAAAQGQDSTIWVHTELVGTQRMLSKKVDVELDFGQSSKFFQDDRIVDPKTGKPKTFNSMVDALNFMGTLGWEFVQAYVVTSGDQSIYRWLVRRAVRVDETGKYVPLTRKEYKKLRDGEN